MPGRTTRSKSPAILDASVRVLILCGPEPVRKREAYEQLKSALEKEHGDVGISSFDGKTAPLADVFDELRTFGLLSSYKLVVVDDADLFVKSHREALERYAAAPVDHATLVLRSVNWNSPRLDKLVAKVGAKLKCEPPKRHEAIKWISDRAGSEHQRTLSGEAAQAMVDRLGPDLLRLDSELAKLALLVDAKQPIGKELVDQVVGRGSDEKAWAVQEAILQAVQRGGGDRLNTGAAIEMLHELVDLSGQPDVLVGYFVTDLMRKLYLALHMKRQGVSDRQMASELQLWGERQALFNGFLRRLDDRRAGRLFDQIVDLDQRAKSGLGNPMRNLECFCASLADE